MTYSKKIPIITGAIFISVLIFCLLNPSYEMTSVYMTAITSSAAAFTGNLVYYSKKASLENIAKIDCDCYKQKAQMEIQVLEAKLRLKKKYSVTDMEIEEIECKSDLDEMTNESFQDIRSNIMNARTENQMNSSDFT